MREVRTHNNYTITMTHTDTTHESHKTFSRTQQHNDLFFIGRQLASHWEGDKLTMLS